MASNQGGIGKSVPICDLCSSRSTITTDHQYKIVYGLSISAIINECVICVKEYTWTSLYYHIELSGIVGELLIMSDDNIGT